MPESDVEPRIVLSPAEREFVVAYSAQGMEARQRAAVCAETIRNFLSVVVRNHGHEAGIEFELSADCSTLTRRKQEG